MKAYNSSVKYHQELKMSWGLSFGTHHQIVTFLFGLLKWKLKLEFSEENNINMSLFQLI